MKLTRLEIRHLPGIDAPFVVDFAPDTVNLVTGPNGSGKSSLVRAVRALIYPNRADPYVEVSAQWLDNAGALHCDRVGPTVQWLRRNQTVQPPRLPGPEAIGAYLISSEDLSAPGQTDAHIAGQLQTLLAGGYDLEAILAAEPFASPPRPQKLARELDGLQQAIVDKEAEYAALHEEMENLQQLEAELTQATQSAALLGAIDDAIALADAHSARAALESSLIEEFAGGMDRLHGDEVRRLDQALERLEQQQQTMQLEEEALERERAELERSGVDDPGELESIQAQLADARDALASIEQQLSACREQIDLAEQAAAKAARRLGSARPDQVDQLDQSALEVVERQVEKVLGQRERIRALTGQLFLAQSSRNPTGRPQGDLRTARSALHDWLALARLNPLEGLLWGSLGLAALLGSLRVLSAQELLSQPELLLLAVLAAGLPLAMLGRFLLRLRDRDQARRSYLETTIEPPLGWTESEVRNRLERLDSELEAATQHEVSQARATELREQLNVQRGSLEQARERLKTLADKLGIEADPRLETGFLLWCRHLQDWQREQQRLNEQRLRQDHLTQQLNRQIEHASQLLSQHGMEPQAISSRVVAGLVHQLQPRIRRYSELYGSVQARQRRLKELDADIAQIKQQIGMLYENAGIADGDAATLRQKIDHFPTWQALDQQRREVNQDIARLEKRLEDHPELIAQARHQQRQVLQTLCSDHTQRAAKRDGLNRRIAATHARHSEALKRRDLQQLVSELEQQRERLAGELDAQMIAAAGQHLIDDIRSDYRSEHEPALLAAADRWLDSFTRHRYRLLFQDNSFFAIDTRSGRRHGLGELSSGGRAQFMLAVRLAWIEQQERDSEPLPVFMDEVLTTSDADRYRAVVGAVRTLLENGRQLFYLTAQSDDAQAWWEWLGGDIEPHAIDMAEVRKSEVSQLEFRMPESASVAATLPDPTRVSPEEWMQAARVDLIDPWKDSGQVHIAHVLTDDLTLAHRLVLLGVEGLGELERLIERIRQPDAESGDLARDQILRLQPRVHAARLWLTDWRRHHRRPVGTAELVRCGLISDRFLPRVSEEAAAVGGDPARLIKRLESGKVARFRSDVVEQLRGWLRDEGYWPDKSTTPALTAADLMLETGLDIEDAHRLIAALSNGINDPLAAADGP